MLPDCKKSFCLVPVFFVVAVVFAAVAVVAAARDAKKFVGQRGDKQGRRMENRGFESRLVQRFTLRN